MDLQLPFAGAAMFLSAVAAYNNARVRSPGWPSAILASVAVLVIGTVALLWFPSSSGFGFFARRVVGLAFGERPCRRARRGHCKARECPDDDAVDAAKAKFVIGVTRSIFPSPNTPFTNPSAA
jgi:hypothetical protein